MPSTAAGQPTKEQCVSANESAQTLMHVGQLQLARLKLTECVAAACPGPVRDDCAQRLEELLRIQPTIVFDAKDSLGHDVAEVTVRLDGQPFATRLDGRALPVDPGEHTFAFEIAGQEPTIERFVIKEGEKERRERVVIGQGPERMAAPAVAPVPVAIPASTAPGDAVRTPAASRTSAESPVPSNDQRIAGIAIGVAGLAALGLGAGFGVSASSKWSSAQDACGTPTKCPNYLGAVADHDSAASAATVSTIGFVAGGVLFAGGVVLYITAPRNAGSSTGSVALIPSVLPGGGGVRLRSWF
jgi:hypothetical protein